MAKFRIKFNRRKLRINTVDTDGNCFFRAISDQLFGGEDEHKQLRKTVVQHLRENKEEYKLFIENDMNIDKYINLMSLSGTWGGQLEMSVLAKIYKFNVIMHQVDNEDIVQQFYPWNT